ncbi:MAG: flagellar hook-basal body protein [Thermoguttaceae bacterium]|jgi:flagellar basal-body rod protein FlgF/flagellar basal-body rod protein FlgG|nr:flagellar hook-basal body protein [Thermoguttaceae bacterium]
MPYGLYISAEGAHAQSKRLEVIANNLANVDTVGFKRELAIFQARYAEAIEEGLIPPGEGRPEDIGGGVEFLATRTDFAPGPLKHTRQKTDMAIEGEGFFVVAKDGEQYLTRAGNFLVAANGELRTQQGYAVLSDAGVPMVINPLDATWEITPAGTLRQLGTAQNLAIVQPGSYAELLKMGENLFRPLAGPEPVPIEDRRVVSGYLEGSGVKATSEMTAMVEASRVLEANINMMKAQDQMLSGLVNRVLRV